MRSVISSCYPSEEVADLVADADEEHLDVLEGSGSKMLEDAIQSSWGQVVVGFSWYCHAPRFHIVLKLPMTTASRDQVPTVLCEKR